MSNLKKPKRLSGERREKIRQQAARYLVHDERISWVWELLAEVDALNAELEERTRERDEAARVAQYLGRCIREDHQREPLTENWDPPCKCGICDTSHPSGHWLQAVLDPNKKGPANDR